MVNKYYNITVNRYKHICKKYCKMSDNNILELKTVQATTFKHGNGYKPRSINIRKNGSG